MNLIKLLILLILVAGDIGVFSIKYQGAIGNWSRFQRANDEGFTKSLHKMQMISRITNGISLQQGFVQATIPFAELISEVLNLGTITPSAIDKFDVSTLGKVVEAIEDLPETMKKTDGTDKVETRLLLLRSIVDLSNGVEKLTLPDASLSTELTKIGNLTMNKLEEYAPQLIKLVKAIAAVEKHGSKDLSEGDLQDLVIDIHAASQYLPDEIHASIKSKSTDEAETVLSSFLSLHESMQLFVLNIGASKYDKDKDKSDTTMVENNFKKMGEAINSVRSSAPKINDLRHIFGSRHHRSGDRVLQYTPGFSKGSSDFALISADLSNDWVQQVIGGEDEKLAAALKNVVDFGKRVDDLEKSIASPSEVNFETISNVLGRVTDNSKLSTSFGPLSSKLVKIQEEAKDGLIPNNMDTYDLLFEYISLLFRQLKAVDTVAKVSQVLGAQDLKDHFKNIERLTAITSKSDYAEIYNKLKASNAIKVIIEKLKVFPKILVEVESIDEALNAEIQNDGVKLVVGPAIFVQQHFQELKTFIADSNNFLTMLNNLRKIKEFEYVRPVIEMRRRLSLQNKKSNFTLVASTFNKIKPKLKEMEDWISGLKGFNSVETDALIQLGDVKKDSDTLGSATRAITSMANTIKLNTKQLQLYENLVKLETENAQKFMKPEVVKHLKSFEGLSNEMKNLYRQINQFRSTITDPTSSTKLADHSPLFEGASKVVGIDRNFMAIKSSIRKLINKLSSPANEYNLRQAMDQMEVFDELGLNYSSHKIALNAAKTSLNSMDLTFAKLPLLYNPTTTSAAVTKTPEGTRSGPSKPGGQSGAPGSPAQSGSRSQSGVEATTEASGGLSWWVYLLIVAGIVGAAFIVYYFVWGKICCKENKPPVPPPDNIVIVPVSNNTQTEKPEPIDGEPESKGSEPAKGTSQKPDPIDGEPVSKGSKPVKGTSQKPDKNENKSQVDTNPSKGDKPEEKCEKIEEKVEQVKPKAPVPVPTILREVGLKLILWFGLLFTDKRYQKNLARCGSHCQYLDQCGEYTSGCPKFSIADYMKMPVDKPIGNIRKFCNAVDIDVGGGCTYSLFRGVKFQWCTNLKEELGVGECTMESIYRMAQQKNVRCVMWNSKYYEGDSKERELLLPMRAGRTLTDDTCKLTVTCTDLNMEDVQFIKQTLVIKFEDSESFEIELISNGRWTDFGPSDDLNLMLDAWKAIREKGDIIFACDEQDSYCLFFIFLEMAYRELSGMKEVPTDPDWAKNFTKSILVRIVSKYKRGFFYFCNVYGLAILSVLKMVCDERPDEPEFKNFQEKHFSRYKPYEGDKDNNADKKRQDERMRVYWEETKAMELKKKENIKGKESKTSKTTESAVSKVEKPKKKQSTGKSVSKGTSSEKKKKIAQGNKNGKKSLEKNTKKGASKVKKGVDVKKPKAKK